TPVSGHRSSATTSASWASSSATPTSRTMRQSPAMSRADSILQTASIARCASVADITTDHNIFTSGAQDDPPPGAPLVQAADLSAALRPGLPRDPLETLAQLGRHDVGGKVRELVDLPDLDYIAVLGRAAARPLDGLRFRLRLDQPVPPDGFLGLGERAVHDRGLAAGEADARGLGGRGEGRPGQPRAPPPPRHRVAGDLPRPLRGGERAGIGLFVGLRDHQHHEAHRSVLSLGRTVELRGLRAQALLLLP